jgi:hypothetical protein
MPRKTFAVAVLALSLLFCGLDSSAVGAPAEPETALHALVRSPDAGARGDTVALLAAAFVALAAIVTLVVPDTGRRIVSRWTYAAEAGPPPIGWLSAHAERGPPTFA